MKVDKHILKRTPSFLSMILNLGHEQLSDLMSLVHGNIVKPLSINPVDLVSPLSGVVDWQPWLLPYRLPVARRCHASQDFHFSRLLRGSRLFWRLVLSLGANYWKFWTRSRLEKSRKDKMINKCLHLVYQFLHMLVILRIGPALTQLTLICFLLTEWKPFTNKNIFNIRN